MCRVFWIISYYIDSLKFDIKSIKIRINFNDSTVYITGVITYNIEFSNLVDTAILHSYLSIINIINTYYVRLDALQFKL